MTFILIAQPFKLFIQLLCDEPTFFNSAASVYHATLPPKLGTFFINSAPRITEIRCTLDIKHISHPPSSTHLLSWLACVSWPDFFAHERGVFARMYYMGGGYLHIGGFANNFLFACLGHGGGAGMGWHGNTPPLSPSLSPSLFISLSLSPFYLYLSLSFVRFSFFTETDLQTRVINKLVAL